MHVDQENVVVLLIQDRVFFNAELYIAENNAHNTSKTQLSLGSFSFSLKFFRKVTNRRARSHFVSYVVSVEIVQLNEDSDTPRYI